MMENRQSWTVDRARWSSAAHIAAVAGTGLAFFTFPIWAPALSASLAEAEPKVYGYLSRAGALVAFALLWLSVASGLIISNRPARIGPGGFTAFDLHQLTSLLGLGFAVFHALALLGDRYIEHDLVQLLVPFASSSNRPLWIGLGQMALYLSALVTLTFYVRRRIGDRLWHLIHFLSYAAFSLALAYGVAGGSEDGSGWASAIYWLGGLSLPALAIYRLAASRTAWARRQRSAQRS